MDLKRAWRNGFLVLVIFAIPLSDLYINRLSNLTIADIAAEALVRRTGVSGIDASASDLRDDNMGNMPGVPSSWEDTVDENQLTIPRSTFAELLLESGNSDFGDVLQLDPQDILLSERIGKIDLDPFGSTPQNGYAYFGPGAAPGLSGSFTPAIFASGGKKSTAGLQSASGDDSESSFSDPVPDSLAEAETGAAIDTASDTIVSGIGGESLHIVPEPSSFVLITIGVLSVATRLYRKSKASTRLS